MTRRHQQALDAHLTRMTLPEPNERQKGSYAWKELRGEAERRFAAGEDPRRVIDELARRPLRGASGPSYRTLRRWFTDSRWTHLAADAEIPGGAGVQALRRGHNAKPAASTAPDEEGRAATRSTTRPIRGPC